MRVWRAVPVAVGAVVCAGLLLAGALEVVDAAVRAHTNSDLLHVADVYRDLVGDPVDMSQWRLPPAPYYVPDWLLLFPLFSIVGVGAAYHVYGLVLVALQATAAGAIARSVWAGAAAVLWILLALDGAHPALGVSVLPVFHAGGTLMLLVALALALRDVRRPAVLAAIVALTAASDLLFVVQCVLPLLMAARRETCARTVGVVVAAGVAAILTMALIAARVRSVGNPLHELLARPEVVAALCGAVLAFGAACVWLPRAAWWAVGTLAFASVVVAAVKLAPPGWPGDRLAPAARDLGTAVRTDPFVWLPLPVAIGASAVHVRSPDARLRMLARFFLACVITTLAAAALTWEGLGDPLLEDPSLYRVGTPRHMQPLWMLSPIVVATFAAARAPRPALAAAIGVAGLAALRVLPVAPPRFALPYAPHVRCVDEAAAKHGLRAGYGEYWTARSVEWTSRRGVKMAQLELWLEDLPLQLWVNNPARLLGGPPADFAIAFRDLGPILEQRFGAPRAAERCGPFDVWVYDRPDDVAFRNHTRVAALRVAGRPLPPHPPAKGDVVHVETTGEAEIELDDGVRMLVPAGPTPRIVKLSRRQLIRAVRGGEAFVYDDSRAP